jgi:hypothetical protein
MLCTESAIVSNGIAPTFAVLPANLNCLPWEFFYHEIASWGDFNGSYFVVNVLPVLAAHCARTLHCDVSRNQDLTKQLWSCT